MIKEFNVSTAATANIYGEHYAETVYAKNVVFHTDDIEYGIMTCDQIVIGQEIPEYSSLNYNDRVYTGTLHCRDVVERPKDVQEDI